MVSKNLQTSTTGQRQSAMLSLAQPICCPEGCFMRRADVELLAEDWAQKVPSRTGLDWMAGFLKSMGGEIRPSADPNSLRIVAERLDCFVTTGADLWKLAEAMGHLVLHLGHQEPPDNYAGTAPVPLAVPSAISPRGPYARARMEAVWFALPFLTPAPQFHAAWTRRKGNLRAISAEMCLPVTMIGTRAISLGLDLPRA